MSGNEPVITIGSLPTALEVRRAADTRRAQRDRTHLQTCLELLITAFEQDDKRGADLPYPVPEELARALRDRGFALDTPTHQTGCPSTVAENFWLHGCHLPCGHILSVGRMPALRSVSCWVSP